jgi:hypothetical protein
VLVGVSWLYRAGYNRVHEADRKEGAISGKGGETPGAKEKGMVVYGITMTLCFANGQTGRWAGGPGGCRRLSAVLGRGVKFTPNYKKHKANQMGPAAH